MAAIQIRVGASLDRSTATIFQQIADQARRANRTIADEARKAAKEEESVWRNAQRELARMERETAQERKKAQRDAASAAKSAAKEEERAQREKFASIARMEREQTRTTEREARERAKAEERAAKQAAAAWKRETEQARQHMAVRSRDRAAAVDKLGGLAGGALLGAGAAGVRFGVSMLADMAQGAGVRLDMGSHFAAASDLQTRATQLSNSAYMPGTAGANGRRQDPRALMAQAYEVGNATGTAANEVMGGLQKFVGKTGDLESGRAVIADLAKLSKATGSNLEDMADAAADVSNQLGDVPDKGARVKDVMMAIAGQGKVGAVEIKDLANQMAKVAANATMMTGDASQNIKMLGAFAQESRAKGGSASATQAATSVASIFSVFSKGARLDAFKGLGVETADQKSGKLRKLDDILLDTLVASQRKGHGDVNQVNRLFGSTFATEQARRGVRGFEKTFREAYAGAKGTEEEKIAAATKAYREELEHLMKVQMSETELNESFAASMKTGSSQAEVFNNQLQQIAQDAQTKIGPALIALAPAVIKATAAVAKFAADVLGLAPKPGEGNNAEVEAAKKDEENAKTVAGDKNATPEQRKMAYLALSARKESLRTARTNTATEIKQAENTGGFVSNVAHQVYGGALDDLTKGNYGHLALARANPIGALYQFGKAAYQASAGTTDRQVETGKNVANAVQTSGQLSDEEKRIDEQMKALEKIDSTLSSKTLKVEVVNLKGGGSGAGQNRGLEPTE